MLAAIAVLAIAGGVYAAKAKDLSKVVFTHNPLDLPTVCTVPLRGITTIPNTSTIVLFATTTTTKPCVLSTFYTTF